MQELAIAHTEPKYLQHIYMQHCTKKYYIDDHIKQ